MSGERLHLRTPWLDRDSAPPARAAPSPDRSAPAEPADRRDPAGPPRAAPIWVSTVYVLFGLFVVGLLLLSVTGNGQAVGALLAAPMVLVLTHYIARRLAAIDANPRLVPIIMGGICLKLIASFVRFSVAARVYGTGDFFDYDRYGRRIASGLRHGHLLSLPGRLAGTNFMRLVTGFIYFAVPARMTAGFAVYGWLSFVGVLFFWRAYRVAISPKHDTTYLTWLVLFPSLVYWSSAIGKDAFMVLAAGIAAYGVACLLVSRTAVGVVGVAVGILGMVMVRPHFALAVCGGLALAVLLRSQRGGFLRTLITLLFVVLLGAVVLKSASSFFGLSSFSRTSIIKTLNDASKQSSEGGSAFKPVVVSSPVQLPLAAVTVLYRPLPFEAHSPQELLTAVEGAVLLVLTLRSLRRIGRALRRSRQYPYLLYCFGAMLVFIIAFSGFSNFGLLARERGVIQPLFLVFVSLPRDIDDLLPMTPSRARYPAPRRPGSGPRPWPGPPAAGPRPWSGPGSGPRPGPRPAGR